LQGGWEVRGGVLCAFLGITQFKSQGAVCTDRKSWSCDVHCGVLTDLVQTLAFQQTGHIQWIFLGGTEELSMGTGKVVVTGSGPISLGYAYHLAISSSIDLFLCSQ
jgi:hypothetical protein